MKKLNRRGVSLAAALIIIIAVAGIAMSLTVLVGSFAKASEAIKDDEDARNLAIGVIEKLRMYLYMYRKNATWSWDDILTYCDNALTQQGFNKVKLDAQSNIDLVKAKFNQDTKGLLYKNYLAAPDVPQIGNPNKSKIELDSTMTTDTWGNFTLVPANKTMPATPMVQFCFNMPVGNGAAYYCFVRDNPDDSDPTTLLPDANPLVDKDSSVDLYVFVTLRTGYQKLMIARLYYQSGSFSPDAAITTGKTAKINGNPQISGTKGSVHANMNIIMNGNPTISQNLTASGTLYINGSPTVGGMQASGVPQFPLPDINVSDYKPRANYILRADGKMTDALGNVIPRALVDAWGFKFNPGQGWEVGNNNTNPPAASYYVDSNMHISSNPQNLIATFFVNGSAQISGNPKIQPFASNVAFMTQGDLKISGNPGYPYTGLFIAREQIDVSGNPELQGALVALDKADIFNEVSTNSQFDDQFSGNASINYNGLSTDLIDTEERVIVKAIRVAR